MWLWSVLIAFGGGLGASAECSMTRSSRNGWGDKPRMNCPSVVLLRPAMNASVLSAEYCCFCRSARMFGALTAVVSGSKTGISFNIDFMYSFDGRFLILFGRFWSIELIVLSSSSLLSVAMVSECV